MKRKETSKKKTLKQQKKIWTIFKEKSKIGNGKRHLFIGIIFATRF